MYTYTTQLRASNAIAREFALDAADCLYETGRRASFSAMTLLAHLQEAGASEADLNQVRAVLTDTFNSIQGGIDRTLDREGLATDRHQIDLSEVL